MLTINWNAEVDNQQCLVDWWLNKARTQVFSISFPCYTQWKLFPQGSNKITVAVPGITAEVHCDSLNEKRDPLFLSLSSLTVRKPHRSFQPTSPHAHWPELGHLQIHNTVIGEGNGIAFRGKRPISHHFHWNRCLYGWVPKQNWILLERWKELNGGYVISLWDYKEMFT